MNKIYLLFFSLFSISCLYSQQPEIILNTGSRSISSMVAFSHDNKYIVTAEQFHTLKLWDVEKKQFIKEFIGHEDVVSFAAFSKDDKQIISASWDGTVRIWDVESGKEFLICEKNDCGIRYASISPDYHYLIGATSDSSLVVWDLENGWKFNKFGKIDDDYAGVSYVLNGEYIVTSSNDNYIRFWTPKGGVLVKKIEAHHNAMSSLSCSPNSNFMVTSSYDTTLKIWNLTNGDVLNINNFESPITSSCIGNDGNTLLIGDKNGNIKVIDINSLDEKLFLYGHKLTVQSIAISSDGKLAASTSYDRTIKIWNLENGKEINTFSSNRFIVSSVKSFNGGKKLVSASFDGSIKIWDLETGNGSKSFKIHDAPITSMSISHDKKYILTTSFDETLKLFDLTTEKIVQTYSDHKNIVSFSDFSPDDKYIISASYDKTLKLWETSTGIVKMTFPIQNGFINCVAFSPDGNYVLSGGSDSSLTLWDVKTGNIFQNFVGHHKSVNCVAFSHNGNYIFSGGSDQYIYMWDISSSKLIKKFKGHTWYITDLFTSTDDKLLYSSSYDESIAVWDINKTSQVRELTGHQNVVNTISLSDDSKYLISGSWDGTIKMWNTSDYLLRATLVPLENNEYLIATPDNYYTCSKNGYRAVSFNYLDKIYPFEQFDIIYNRPDFVLTKIGYSSIQTINMLKHLYEMRLKKINMSENSIKTDLHIPDLNITNKKELKEITDNQTLNLSIKAQDDRCRLSFIKVLVNDIPIFGKEGIDILNANSYTFDDQIKVPLTDGLNKIKVSAVNEWGAESLREIVEVFFMNTATEEKPNLYVIVIGISDYKNSLLNLQYAANDANDFAKFLEEYKDNFNSTSIFPLYNKDATKENILKLKKLLSLSKINDEVMIYVSGQGILDKNFNYYFATYDVNYLHPKKNGLSMDELEDLFDGIEARKRILFINTSNSGEVDVEEEKRRQTVGSNQDCLTLIELPMSGIIKSCRSKGASELQKFTVGELKNSIEIQNELFVDLSKGTGAVVIASSSGAYEYPYSNGDYNNGVFTYSIMDGIRSMKADKNGDGKITVSELKDYIINSCKELTDNLLKPTVRKELLDNDFVIW